MASYSLLFSITIIFLLMYPAPTKGSRLGQSQILLTHQIYKISKAQHLLRNLSKIYDENSSINVCTKLVNEGHHLLRHVRQEMNRSTPLDSDTSFSLQTMFSAALTYLRTCTRTLKEERNKKSWPFGNLLREMNTVSGDCQLEKLTLGVLDLATLPRKKPIQGAPARDVLTTLRRIPTSRRLIVAQDGSGDFSTVSAAVAAAPARATEYFLIIVKEGRYKENVFVPKDKPFLVLAGAGKNATVITGNRSSEASFSTYETATAIIEGHNFIGYNLAFENTAGPECGQAVAMLCSANLSVFYRCSFLGYQDTLYAHAWLQFYRECNVYGTIDFILGDATAVFQSCNIVVRQPLHGQSNPIVAQQRQCPEGRTGFTIQNSVVWPDRELLNTTKTYLGRPWGRSTRVAYISNRFNVMIEPVGWLEWIGVPSQVYLGEFRNAGLGANMTGRVAWPGVKSLTQAEAYNLTLDVLFDGGSWLDKILVPHTKGL